MIQELKRESSKWVKTKTDSLREFHWQNGYGAFSVSPRELATVSAYIANQQAHHATELSRDEFRAIPAEYQVEYDEQYVWD